MKEDLEEEKQSIFEGFQCSVCFDAPVRGKLYHSLDLVQTFCEKCAQTCDYAKKNALIVQFSREAALPPKFSNQPDMMMRSHIEEQPFDRKIIQPPTPTPGPKNPEPMLKG